jgi:hypothetical protein
VRACVLLKKKSAGLRCRCAGRGGPVPSNQGYFSVKIPPDLPDITGRSRSSEALAAWSSVPPELVRPP